MGAIAIIGGTGLLSLEGLKINRRQRLKTPYGESSSPLIEGEFAGQEVLFLPRHGSGHTIPPHKINYRANIWALREQGAVQVIAVNAVGGIAADMGPGKLVIPEQIIDYTYSREQTFFEGSEGAVTHIDFTHPYCADARRALLDAAQQSDVVVVDGGTYAATQGPRLETAAEIDRLERDGADLVGMTGMPEAALARELGLCYGALAVVANWGAGRGDSEITMEEIETTLSSGMVEVKRVLEGLMKVV